MNPKDVYIQKLQEQLDAWKKQMDEFRKKSSDMAEQTRGEYQKQLDALQAHGENVRRQLDATRQASEQAWTDMKVKADQAWDNLHEATKRALDKFK
jgi:uncharacterized protein YxeA